MYQSNFSLNEKSNQQSIQLISKSLGLIQEQKNSLLRQIASYIPPKCIKKFNTLISPSREKISPKSIDNSENQSQLITLKLKNPSQYHNVSLSKFTSCELMDRFHSGKLKESQLYLQMKSLLRVISNNRIQFQVQSERRIQNEEQISLQSKKISKHKNKQKNVIESDESDNYQNQSEILNLLLEDNSPNFDEFLLVNHQKDHLAQEQEIYDHSFHDYLSNPLTSFQQTDFPQKEVINSQKNDNDKKIQDPVYQNDQQQKISQLSEHIVAIHQMLQKTKEQLNQLIH